MEINFKFWLENLEAKKSANRSIILSFLKDKTGISDDEQLILMPLDSFNPKIVSELLNLGIMDNIDDSLRGDIKNGNLTILDLIGRISDNQSF